jgi:hypothetical protein
MVYVHGVPLKEAWRRIGLLGKSSRKTALKHRRETVCGRRFRLRLSIGLRAVDNVDFQNVAGAL